MSADRPSAIVRELWPLLFVQDIERSVAFWHERLGFDVVGEDRPGGHLSWCRLRRGGTSIMLQQDEPEDGPAEGRGRGVTLYFVCDDADLMHVELARRGLSVEPPTIAPYGMKQLFVPEPDGYAVCFESPVERP